MSESTPGPRKVKRVVKKQPIQSENVILDSLRDAMSHMVTNVLIPGLRDSVYQGGVSVLNALIYQGEPGPKGKAYNYGSRKHTSYDRFSRNRSPFLERDRRAMRFDRFSFDTYKEAKEVLDNLYSSLSQYGSVTVSDFYDLAGYTNTDFTKDNWGWVSLTGSKILQTKYGFVITLPDPEPLN